MLPLIPAQINKTNLQIVKENIIKHSPHPKKVHIIAVTKTFSFSTLQSAVKNNLFHIGENKIQETKKKINKKKLHPKTKIHLIGHLQSNKAGLAVSLYDIIQSVDSLKILKKINQIAEKQNKNQKIFLQINTSNTSTQKGFVPQETIKVAEQAKKLTNISLCGIMSIGAHTKNQKKIQQNFKQAALIQQTIYTNIDPRCASLSLGMSGDYVLALQAGSTHLRLGTILFNKRNEK